MLRVLVDILVPVYLIVAVGFTLSRTVRVQSQWLAGLSYWVLGPAFIFDVLATTELALGLVGQVVVASTVTVVVVGVVAAASMKLAGSTASMVGAGVLTSIHGNVGNFGLAIGAFALGDGILPIAGVVMVTINTIGIIAGVGMATAREGSIWTAVRMAVTSPLTLAVIPALAVQSTGASLPVWLDRPVSLLAGALIPVMLVTVGLQLAEMPKALPRVMSAIPLSIKLVVSPVIAFGVIGLMGMTGIAGDVVILQSAMPAAVFTSLVAIEHDLEADFVTSVLLIGTLLAAVTLPVVILFL